MHVEADLEKGSDGSVEADLAEGLDSTYSSAEADLAEEPDACGSVEAGSAKALEEDQMTMSIARRFAIGRGTRWQCRSWFGRILEEMSE